MLQQPDLQTVEELRRRLQPSQLAWLGGYFSAAAGGGVVAPAVAALDNHHQHNDDESVAVLYGSQTGNGKKIAHALADLLGRRGLRAAATSMENYKTAKLKKEKKLFVVVSTHGEGEPPDDAVSFLAFLQSARAPKLAGLEFAVLALGDSSYDNFCKTGRDLHHHLQKLGAKPMMDVVECDADYESAARKWREAIADKQKIKTNGATNGAVNGAVNGVANGAKVNPFLHTPIIASADVVDAGAPFAAEVLANIKLSGEGRNVRHLELSVAGSNLRPQPGDSIGVIPQNDKNHALLIGAKLGLSADEKIDIDGEVATAGEWLINKLDISRPTLPMLKRYAEVVDDKRLTAMVDARERAMEYIRGRDVLQVIHDFVPPKDSGAEVLKTLRTLAPRLYSLASAREDEAHLLIADAAYYDFRGRLRRGVCSDYLSSLRAGDKVMVYVQDNESFRPPQDADVPLIMIGAGAGVAPFRAFMEEREEKMQNGDAWLFFGERRRREDFYYQREWLMRLAPSQGGLANGGGAALAKLSAAFSRDGGEKVYVQHKLYENAEQLRRWIDNGASIYVCGDDKGMGREVHNALADIAGAETLASLQREKRYRRDVY